MTISAARGKAAAESPAGSSDGAPCQVTQRTLCLLGGPYVVQDRRQIPVPEGSKRLLVYIALREGHVDRRQAAGALWPLGDDGRAGGNLRSALWRLRVAGIEILQSDKSALWLDPQAQLDLRFIESWAARIIEGGVEAGDLRIPSWGPDALDLLPGWYDDWVIFERERLRQRVLHALESLSRQLIQAGRYAEAIEVALEAVRVEPLRESAQRTLLQAHLAEGNLVEARRAFNTYRILVKRELGVAPDPELLSMLLPVGPYCAQPR